MGKKKNNELKLHDLLAYFECSAKDSYPVKKYSSYAKKVVEIAGGENEVIKRLLEIIKDKNNHAPVQTIMKEINKQIKDTDKISDISKDSYKTGFKAFIKSVIGFYNANIWFSVGKEDDNLYLCRLVAQNALFASKQVVKLIIAGELGTAENKNKKDKGNDYASWDHMTHVRNPEYKSKIIPDGVTINNILYKVKGDDNSYANRYIKQAVIESFKRSHNNVFIPSWNYLVNYEACHVWDYPDDPRYFASIANLVLLPSALAQLSDDNDAVKNLLRYHVQEMFDFLPDGKNKLSKPKYYDQVKWRNPYQEIIEMK